MLEIGRRNGLDVGNALFDWQLSTTVPLYRFAEYGPLVTVDDSIDVLWTEFLGERTDQVVVRLSDRILASDDSILAVLAHETTEILALEREFLRAGQRMSSRQVRALIDERVGRLHLHSWDVADAIVAALKGAGRYP